MSQKNILEQKKQSSKSSSRKSSQSNETNISHYMSRSMDDVLSSSKAIIKSNKNNRLQRFIFYNVEDQNLYSVEIQNKSNCENSTNKEQALAVQKNNLENLLNRQFSEIIKHKDLGLGNTRDLQDNIEKNLKNLKVLENQMGCRKSVENVNRNKLPAIGPITFNFYHVDSDTNNEEIKNLESANRISNSHIKNVEKKVLPIYKKPKWNGYF